MFTLFLNKFLFLGMPANSIMYYEDTEPNAFLESKSTGWQQIPVMFHPCTIVISQ